MRCNEKDFVHDPLKVFFYFNIFSRSVVPHFQWGLLRFLFSKLSPKKSTMMLYFLSTFQVIDGPYLNRTDLRTSFDPFTIAQNNPLFCVNSYSLCFDLNILFNFLGWTINIRNRKQWEYDLSFTWVYLVSSYDW